MTVKVSLKVNGKAVSADVEERTLLVSFIRESLRLTGTHVVATPRNAAPAPSA